MRIVSFLPSLILLLLASTPSRGHGYLRTPPARNVLANSDYCPHCLNFGTVKSVSDNGRLRWPEGLRGICGDAFGGPRDHEWGGKYYGDGTPVVSYSRGGIAEIEIFLSTKYVPGHVACTLIHPPLTSFPPRLIHCHSHNGAFRFRVCKVRKGPFDPSEKEQLTEECLDQHVLKQANIPQAQSPGEEWFYTIPSDPSTVQYTMYYQLPEDLVCNGEESACVLQWYVLQGVRSSPSLDAHFSPRCLPTGHSGPTSRPLCPSNVSLDCALTNRSCSRIRYWVSANSCNPPGIPEEYRRPYSLQDCTLPSAPYPEEFVNCADIAIVDTKSGAAQYALRPLSDPLVSPPIVLYSSGKSPRFIDPTSHEELEDASRIVHPDKTLVEKSAARAFCATKTSYGKFPNPASCKSYFLCLQEDSWYFECPLGTAYEGSKERCTLSVGRC